MGLQPVCLAGVIVQPFAPVGTIFMETVNVKDSFEKLTVKESRDR